MLTDGGLSGVDLGVRRVERRVLIIAYFFPPLGGAGVQRTIKFVKYLPSLGWSPVVVTVGESDYPMRDASLLSDIPTETPVFRTDIDDVWARWRWLDSAKFFWRLAPVVRNLVCFPDPWIGWTRYAVDSALEAVEKFQPRVIYSTSSPYTSHLVAREVKKRTGIPWVADFRDEWSENPYMKIGRFGRWRHRRAEAKVLATADRVVAVTPGMTAQFASLAGRATHEFMTITNGYDEDDLNVAGAESERNMRFTVTYAGLFYGARQPDYFLKGLRLAIQGDEELADAMRFVVVGNNQGNPHLDTFEYPNVVVNRGYVSHAEAVALTGRADLLLLVIPYAGAEINYPGKLFEYLASGRHIFALAPPDGAAAELVRQARAGVVVAPDDVEAIKVELLRYFRLWKARCEYATRDWDVVHQYSRKACTAKLERVLNAAAGGKK